MNRFRARNIAGSSLLELLIVTLVMGVLSVATFGILSASMAAQRKFDNKADSIDSNKKAFDQICRIVRMGRTLVSTSDNDSLIIQLPKFSDAGFPYKDSTTGADAVETHLINILPDPNNAGEYIMQWQKEPGSVVPASATNPYLNATQGPVVLLKGIIGPLNAGGALQIFQYIDRNNPGVTQSSPTGISADYTGVVISLETTKHAASAQTGGSYSKAVNFACKTEVFMRNNNNVSQ